MTLTFHWTFDEAAATRQGAVTKVRKQLEDLASRKTPMVEKDAFGPGLYVASDPITSFAYGNILVIVPVKAGCEFGYSNNDAISSENERLMMNSSLTGIVYHFGAEGERAIVLRSPSTIAFESLDSVDTRANEETPLEEIPRLAISPSLRLQDALRHYGRKFPLGFLHKAFAKDLKGMRDEQGSLTDPGLLALTVWDTLNPSSAHRNALLAALRANGAELQFPTCFKETVGGKISIPTLLGACFNRAYLNNIAAVYPQFASASDKEEKMSKGEATRLLIMGDLLPDGWNELSSPQENVAEIIRRIHARKGYAEAANHLLELIDALAIDKVSDSASLDNWPAPALPPAISSPTP